MDLGNVVRFSSHPRPFLVEDTYCNNPDCCCNAVCLTFTELSDIGRSLKTPLSFSARVDLESWQEREPPERSPEVDTWIREFLNQCPPARRTEFKASYEEGKRIARRRAEYTIDADDVLEGALLSYASVLTDERVLSAGGSAYTFEFYHQGREYLVEDLYCPNPACDCQEFHLEFFEVVSGHDDTQPAVRIDQRFLGRVTFAGRLTVVATPTCSRAGANVVLSAWWKEHRRDLEMFKDRYREVKQIGQRSLQGRPSRRLGAPSATSSSISEDVSLDDRPAGNVKVGRNAPCPCGSGKKYKKCCGRKADLPV
jgi:hypothetical protein